MTAPNRRQKALDRDRFDKCRALMERGATDGERAAAVAAATRVAAAAGLTLAEAMAARDSARPKWTESAPSYTSHPTRWPYPFQQPAKRAKPEPVTVEEILRQKAEDLARRKKAAAREEKRMQKVYAEEAREAAAVREAQAARDREWAHARSTASEAGRAKQDAEEAV